MSTEFLVCLGHTPEGERLLLTLLNHIFLTGEVPPDLLTGTAALVPKTATETAVSQIRPILLLEALQKSSSPKLGLSLEASPVEPIFAANATGP